MLEYNDAKHEYRVDGRVLPHVTGIIKSVLPMEQFASDWHMQRGTATHYACELLDRGVLDWSSVDLEILPRVRAYQSFREQYPVAVVANETKLVHPVFLYAGKLDRVFETDEGKLILCDIKNSVSAQVRVQLGLYSLAWEAVMKRKISKAVAVELMGDGRFKCLWVDGIELRDAEKAAIACLTVHNFKTKWGLK